MTRLSTGPFGGEKKQEGLGRFGWGVDLARIYARDHSGDRPAFEWSLSVLVPVIAKNTHRQMG